MNPLPRQNSLARRAKRLAIQVLIALAIALPVRACVITPYRIVSDSMEPELKKGSLALVYRLTSEFQPGDIVAYQNGDTTFVARCESATPVGWKVSRRDEHLEVTREKIIGRVVLATR
jgi:signal peptidase I